jgi:hypothetical protein
MLSYLYTLVSAWWSTRHPAWLHQTPEPAPRTVTEMIPGTLLSRVKSGFLCRDHGGLPHDTIQLRCGVFSSLSSPFLLTKDPHLARSILEARDTKKPPASYAVVDVHNLDLRGKAL